MNDSLLIEGKRLGKRYRFYANPRQRLLGLIRKKENVQEFWALRNVSLGVAKGESLGILGENGAGKSTLLKLLSGTTVPTEGSLRVRGKVTSILELGAGFHPDFTGRDNITTYGLLAGYQRSDIKQRTGDIVDFADIGAFIDRPLRTYSSGMFVRLAFACATGFDPDVLIVDEVLAVGDQYFQKKCADRIVGYKKAGKTIVFCSHNMYQLRELCDRALWLRGGEIASYGDPRLVTEEYLDYEITKSPPADSGAEKPPIRLQEGSLGVIKRAEVCNEAGETCRVFQTGEVMIVRAWAQFSPAVRRPGIMVGVKRAGDLVCYVVSTQIDSVPMIRMENGEHYAELRFLNLELLSGHYMLSLGIGDEETIIAYDVWDCFYQFTMMHQTREYGIFRMDHQWVSDKVGEIGLQTSHQQQTGSENEPGKSA